MHELWHWETSRFWKNKGSHKYVQYKSSQIPARMGAVYSTYVWVATETGGSSGIKSPFSLWMWSWEVYLVYDRWPSTYTYTSSPKWIQKVKRRAQKVLGESDEDMRRVGGDMTIQFSSNIYIYFSKFS